MGLELDSQFVQVRDRRQSKIRTLKGRLRNMLINFLRHIGDEKVGFKADSQTSSLCNWVHVMLLAQTGDIIQLF